MAKAGIENGGISIEEAPGIRNCGKFSMYLAYLKINWQQIVLTFDKVE